ncbi:MAG: RDD family protein, partial [Nevskia sp.]|nr:RDD family protein [Nevskia sp.]
MTPVTIPAPLWRRLAAALYDALVLGASWLVAAFADVVIRDLAGLPRSTTFLQALLFLVGLAIFGWQWTHGGRTVGMRAWRLLLRREDGAPLRWPVAAVRYAAMLASWLVALAPWFLAVLPAKAAVPHRGALLAATSALTLLGVALFFLDGRRRAPHDRIAGTEVV